MCGSGSILPLDSDFGSPGKCASMSSKLSQRPKIPHCGLRDHPGCKTSHSRSLFCILPSTSVNYRKHSKQSPRFKFSDGFKPCLSWREPNLEMLVDFKCIIFVGTHFV